MPIFWCLQKISDSINEIDLTDPYSFLGEQEKEFYQRLKFPKRKGEWLGARLVIKDLIRAADNRWKHKEFQEIEVLNDKSGAPYLVISGGQGHPGRVSLSHSNGYVLCAYSPDDISVGVDLELIEPRPNEFAEDFFTEGEFEQIEKLDIAERNLFVTVIWSSKESVLKALSSGLRVDTRSVEVILPGLIVHNAGWTSLGLNSSLIKNDSLGLVWRREGNFVLTACVPLDAMTNLVRIDL